MSKETLCKEYDSLTELFFDWKKAHEEDTGSQVIGDSFPPGTNGNFANSFCIDGKFDDNISEIEILFICREANVLGKAATDNDFWMRNVVKSKAKNRNNYYDNGKELSKEEKKKDKTAQSKYYNCLMAIANGTTDINNQDAEKLKKCAYMNINKRGGNSMCDLTKLKNYSVLYQNYIKEEISLLKPKKIVVLGNLPNEILNIISSIEGIPTYVYKKHPCVYSKSLMDEFVQNNGKFVYPEK